MVREEEARKREKKDSWVKGDSRLILLYRFVRYIVRSPEGKVSNT